MYGTKDNQVIRHADFRLIKVSDTVSVLYIAMQEPDLKCPPKKSVNLEEAIELTGFGLFNIFIILLTGGCLMCVIMETMGMMFIVPSAQCDLGLDTTEKGILNAISFLGIVFTSNISGYIADSYGRRKTIIASLLSSFLVTTISVFVVQDWLFILLRFFNGALISGASSTVYAYAGEFHDDFHRATVIAWISTFVAMGNMLLSGLAWLILPATWKFHIPLFGTEFRPWRLLVFCYGLPSLLFGLSLLLFPESPKFLMSKDKKEDALKVLQTMYYFNSKKKKFPIVGVFWEQQESAMENDKKGLRKFLKEFFTQTASIFSKRYIFSTIAVCILQYGAFALSSGLSMWYPEILNKLTIYEQTVKRTDIGLCDAISGQQSNKTFYEKQNKSTQLVCSDTIDTNVFETSLITGSALVLVYLIIGYVINYVGKKNLLASILTISAASGIIAQYIVESSVIKGLTSVVLVSQTSIGIINAIVVDLYSTQVRATALAICLMFGRLGAVTGSHVVGPIFYELCDYSFVIMAAAHILLIVLVLSLPVKSTTKKSTTK